MNFGLSADKLIVIAVIAIIVIGPERLPQYAEGFARLVKRAGDYLRGAKDRVTEEMGSEFTDVDWRKLDPRQYDPRRIIGEALLDVPAAPAATITEAPRRERLAAGELPPFDAEAT